MTEQMEQPKVPSLVDVLDEWQSTHDQYRDAREELQAALTAREDAMADVLRLAGVQYGLFPQIVAEVLAEVGLGTPLDDTARDHVRANYVALMQQLEAEWRRANPGFTE